MLRFQRGTVKESSPAKLASTSRNGPESSILDPHHSVMELLQRQMEGSEVPSESGVLGESWQQIRESDVGDGGDSNFDQQSNTSAILSSSSEASEDEDLDIQQQLLGGQQEYKNFHMTAEEQLQEQAQGQGFGRPSLLKGTQSRLSEQDSNRSGSVRTIVDKGSCSSSLDEHELNTMFTSDSMSLTKSTGSSSTSFVMPKLSLTYKPSQAKKLLVVGRLSKRFHQDIPREYRQYFHISQSSDPSEFQNYIGIVIVFQELKEFVAMLNRIVQYTDKKPIIPICQPGQRIRVKNILKSFLKNDAITLWYPPVTIANEKSMEKLFKHTVKLVNKLENEEDVLSLSTSDKSLSDETSGYRKNNRRKKHGGKPSTNYSKWITWGISLTIGVSIGYYATYMITTTLLYGKAESHHANEAKGFSITNGNSGSSSISHSTEYYESTISQKGLLRNTIVFIKRTIHNLNGKVGTFFASITQVIKQTPVREDNQFYTLGYMLS